MYLNTLLRHDGVNFVDHSAIEKHDRGAIVDNLGDYVPRILNSNQTLRDNNFDTTQFYSYRRQHWVGLKWHYYRSDVGERGVTPK
jgi:hypothetical protein